MYPYTHENSEKIYINYSYAATILIIPDRRVYFLSGQPSLPNLTLRVGFVETLIEL